MDAFAWPDFISAVLLIVAIALWGWRMERRLRRASAPRAPVEDEPEGTPYHAYTTVCDRVVLPNEALALLREEDRLAGVSPPRSGSAQERVVKTARWAATEARALERTKAVLDPVLAAHAQDLAVFLLIDHSGSMREPMIAVAAMARWFSRACDAHGVPLAIGGFTTLGWRGGEPRRRWIADGRPMRPGRLCALLHIAYRGFDEPLTVTDADFMLDPSMLRENVDGEAIGWAAALLRARPARRRLLIVLSDGAPVDDSTLAENGPRFLERDVRRVIGEMEAADDLMLGAVGMGYAVDRYYARSRAAKDESELPAALAALVADALSP